jgi:SAM-dependent methyltransferase
MKWDDKYISGTYQPRKEVSALIKAVVSEENGEHKRCLDIACGNGRNAVFLAGKGYDVDAVDVSEVALEMARKRADENNVDVNWILSDLNRFQFIENEYDLIVVDFYLCGKDMVENIKKSLRIGGMIVYEHHLQTKNDIYRGPSKNNNRLGSNELLKFFDDMTVLYYRAGVRKVERGVMLIGSIVVRKTSGNVQEYPLEIGGSMGQK